MSLRRKQHFSKELKMTEEEEAAFFKRGPSRQQTRLCKAPVVHPQEPSLATRIHIGESGHTAGKAGPLVHHS